MTSNHVLQQSIRKWLEDNPPREMQSNDILEFWLGFDHSIGLEHFYTIARESNHDYKCYIARKGSSLRMIFESEESNIIESSFQNNGLFFRDIPKLTKGKPTRVLLVDDMILQGDCVLSYINILQEQFGIADSDINVAVYAMNINPENHDEIEKIKPYLYNKPLRLSEHEMLDLASRFVRVINSMSAPYLGFTPSFFLDEETSNKLLSFQPSDKWSEWNNAKNNMDELAIDVRYFTLNEPEHFLGAGIRIYANKTLKKTRLVPIVWLPEIKTENVRQLYTNLCDILQIKPKYAPHLNETAMFRFIHYVFCCRTALRFMEDFGITDAPESFRTFREAFFHTPLTVTEILQKFGVEEITFLNSNLSDATRESTVIENTTVHKTCEKNVIINLFMDYLNDAHLENTKKLTPLYEIRNNISLSRDDFFWGIQTILDSGKASMHIAHIEENGTIGSVIKGGELLYEKHTSSHPTYGREIFYTLTTLAQNTRNPKNQDLLRNIINNYISKQGKEPVDDKNFERLFRASHKHDMQTMATYDLSRDDGVNNLFFIGLSLYFPDYVRDNDSGRDFETFISKLPSSGYAEALRKGYTIARRRKISNS